MISHILLFWTHRSEIRHRTAVLLSEGKSSYSIEEASDCSTVTEGVIMDFFIDCLLDAWHDTWAMIPIMFLAYLLIEYLQRRYDGDDRLFWNLQKYGPAFGGLLGLLPQCGFSILAAMLYVQKNITLGTVTAVFIATSDEAIPVLISEPSMLPSLGMLLVWKLIIAVAVGFLIDKVLFPRQKIIRFSELPDEGDEEINTDEEESAASCPCCYPQYPIWLSSLLRTAKIYVFVFIVTLAFNLLLGWIGEDRLASVLLQGSWLQPVVAALFGFIPNCAATVILCQLYASHSLTFASLLAGLITNAGLGLVVLWQYSARKKMFWYICLILFISALAAGYLAMLAGI